MFVLLAIKPRTTCLLRNKAVSCNQKQRNVHEIIIFIVVSGCAVQQDHKPVAEPPSIDSIITNQALKSFKTDYSKASNHKAFAQSLSGAWSWKSSMTSVEHAKTSALIACQRNNENSEDLYPCKIINVNDFLDKVNQLTSHCTRKFHSLCSQNSGERGASFKRVIHHDE